MSALNSNHRPSLDSETASGGNDRGGVTNWRRLFASEQAVDGLSKFKSPLFHGEFIVIPKDGTELTTGLSFRERMRNLLENKIGTDGGSPSL